MGAGRGERDGKISGTKGPVNLAESVSSWLSEATLSQRTKVERNRVRNWAPYLCMYTCEVPHNMHMSTGTSAIKIKLGVATDT